MRYRNPGADLPFAAVRLGEWWTPLRGPRLSDRRVADGGWLASKHRYVRFFKRGQGIVDRHLRRIGAFRRRPFHDLLAWMRGSKKQSHSLSVRGSFGKSVGSAAEGGGLVRYRKGRFTNFTTKEGLLHDCGSYGHRRGCRWQSLGRDEGLESANGLKEVLWAYTEEDGLPSGQVTGNPSGTFWDALGDHPQRTVPSQGQEIRAPFRAGVGGALTPLWMFEDHAGALWIYGEGFLVCCRARKIEDYSTSGGADPAPSWQ